MLYKLALNINIPNCIWKVYCGCSSKLRAPLLLSNTWVLCLLHHTDFYICPFPPTPPPLFLRDAWEWVAVLILALIRCSVLATFLKSSHQHFLCQHLHRPPSEVPRRMVLKRLSWRMTCQNRANSSLDSCLWIHQEVCFF